MLGMAFFKSLVKAHGKEYFEPIGQILYDAGIKKPNPLNPSHAWKLKGPMSAYARWWVGQRLSGAASPQLPRMPRDLRRYAADACQYLSSQCFEISGAMRTYQLKLADRQCAMTDLSRRIQNAVVILCTSLYAARRDDEPTQIAASAVCRELWQQLTGDRSTNRDWRRLTELGGALAESGWTELQGIGSEEIMMPYK